MNRDEQKAITRFIEGIVCEDNPPIDVEADAIIRALFVRNPEAAYRVTMLAMARREPVREPVCRAAPARRGWFKMILRRQAAPGGLTGPG